MNTSHLRSRRDAVNKQLPSLILQSESLPGPISLIYFNLSCGTRNINSLTQAINFKQPLDIVYISRSRNYIYHVFLK